MCAAARFHSHHARRELADKLQHLRAAQLPAHHHLAPPIGAAHRKHALGQIDPNRCNFHRGPSSLRMKR
jgi:hypothetical protein